MLLLWLRRTAEIRRQARELREWQEYAEELEAENASLRARLDAERLRHQEREERLIDRVLVTRSTYGISDPPKAAVPKRGVQAGELSALQRAELEQWQEAAEEQGRARIEGERLWWKIRTGTIPEHLRDPFEDVLTGALD